MDWLTKLRWIGPWIARVMRTHAWRSFEHLQRVHWTRLAAAVTFTSFLSLFPLITVAAAIGAALLSEHRLQEIEQKVSQQVPGISDQLNINGLVDNAGTVGLIAGALLLFTGFGWVASLRDCLRAVWDKDDEDENPFLRKLKDGGILLGLGGAAVVSLGASGFATAAVGWAADRIGFEHSTPGRFLLTAAGFCIAVIADFVLMVYLLTLLPGVEPPRRTVVVAGLIGAIGFELLKVLISRYLQDVAGKSMYGAFGVPVALLLWFNFMAKLLLYCAAWTAVPREGDPATEAESPATAR
ncbi:YihY/virulence factor BrkB family protein [Streptomyces sp. H10-C2]|uniref:YihY/virulence factor BrkB family protein n=1 Tax=unclassified Streptomyces TaxID=2593676 RepID=UPI0024BA9F11|nr:MULTISPECIES: YihY/virulence factor BrkB family protein [unclassified Streptomyces]MDJ0340532.1 YihY/virulence factor BrkB family protein [Streptomyces sp. PH10-H1]MDJ0370180.1 YihY/virulence factor BrkB family protein [Streptomyces sp. H10-C2]